MSTPPEDELELPALLKLHQVNYRRKTGLTQAELAHLVGLNGNTLSQITHGKLRLTEDVKKRIMKELDLDEDQSEEFEAACEHDDQVKWRKGRGKRTTSQDRSSTAEEEPPATPPRAAEGPPNGAAPRARPPRVTLWVILPIGAAVALIALVLFGTFWLLNSRATTVPSGTWHVQREGPCKWAITFRVRGLRPGSRVLVNDRDFTHIDCKTGAVAVLSWPYAVDGGVVLPDGEWDGGYTHVDYGTYHYEISDDAGHIVRLTISYGKSG